MKPFKDFLREMPELVPARKDQHFYNDGYEPIKKAGFHPNTGEFYKSFGKNKNHRIYGNIGDGYINSIHAVGSSGQNHYVVDGDHDKKTNSFKVKSVESNESRRGKYADVIDHMISHGHVKTWESDTVHTIGSKSTYADLINRKHLAVKHNGTVINNTDDLENAYKSHGSFTVIKR